MLDITEGPRLTPTPRRLAAALLAAGLVIGCGGDTSPKLTDKQVEDRIYGGATADEKAKVQEYIKAANIDGDVTAIEDKGDFWYVDVLKRLPAGKRGAPSPPKSYKVMKADGKVTDRK